LSLQIYLDDCANAGTLVSLLRAAGHQVTIPADVGTSSSDDAIHWRYARENHLTLMTKNPRDFKVLHAQSRDHSGILAIYQDNDPERDMSYPEIVRAIANIENAGIPISGEFHILNAWRY
jgi:hypothetical protein